MPSQGNIILVETPWYPSLGGMVINGLKREHVMATVVEREGSAPTCHHLRPVCHGKLVSKPALTILPLIPAPSKRPNTVRRNKETTSWSRGESRSVCVACNQLLLDRVALSLTEFTYGSSAPPHLPLYPSPYLGPCRPERPLRRWAGSGSDTTALCRRDTAWKGCLGCRGGGSRTLFQSIYLSIGSNHCKKTYKHGDSFCVMSQYPHLQKLVASHLLPSAATVGSYGHPRVSIDRQDESDEKSDLHQTD